MLARLGYESGECEDPYTATLELTRRRLAYRALILSLAGLYREELGLISTVKRRFPHVEIWLCHTDGRQAALAESMRLGADGLLDDDGFHRIAAPPVHETVVYQSMPISSIPKPTMLPELPKRESAADQSDADDPTQESKGAIGEPVLTAEELRALLQDQPVMPPSATDET
jgi:hypothetical protein